MFGIFKRKDKALTGDKYFPLTTDIHSHILPGIDDGSPDVETSIELIKGLMEVGVKRSIATPHIIGDMYPNNRESINIALNILRKEIENCKIDFEVDAAAEYMLDSYFLELLQKGAPLMTLKERIILTEFSYSSMPDHVEEMSFAIFTEGYIPILAHPERYAYVYNNYKLYHRWAELGFQLQVNLLSVVGYYGKEAAKAANYLLKNDLVSFIATDLHHNRHLEALKSTHSQKLFKNALGHKSWNEKFLD